MPYKSKAQQRYMHAAAERGEISKKTVADYDSKTDFKHLPEKKKKAKRKKKMEKKRSSLDESGY